MRTVVAGTLTVAGLVLWISFWEEPIGRGAMEVIHELPQPPPPPPPKGFAPRECRTRSLNSLLRLRVKQNVTREASSSRMKYLQQCIGPQGPVGDYLDFFLSTANASEEDEELYAQLAGSRFNSCAVVGSGGSLHGSGLGQQIDSHDVIIRMNHHVASEEGRDHLGCRTTFHAIHPANAGNVFDRLWQDGALMPLLLERGYYSGHWLKCFLEPEANFNTDTCTCMLNRSKTDWTEYYKHVHASTMVRFFQGKKVKPECIYEPEYKSWRARPWAWTGAKSHLDRGHPCVRAAGLKKMPSSGFRSLIMSMHFCNYVYLYGMADSSDRYDKQSPDKNSLQKGKSYFNIHKKHDFHGEHQFFALLRNFSVVFQPDA